MQGAWRQQGVRGVSGSDPEPDAGVACWRNPTCAVCRSIMPKKTMELPCIASFPCRVIEGSHELKRVTRVGRRVV
jgi:hypothetical protein